MIMGLKSTIIPEKCFSFLQVHLGLRSREDDVPQNTQPNIASLASTLLCLLQDHLDRLMECV